MTEEERKTKAREAASKAYWAAETRVVEARVRALEEALEEARTALARTVMAWVEDEAMAAADKETNND